MKYHPSKSLLRHEDFHAFSGCTYQTTGVLPERRPASWQLLVGLLVALTIWGLVDAAPPRICLSRDAGRTQERSDSLHRGRCGVFRRPTALCGLQPARLDLRLSAAVRHGFGAPALPAHAGPGDGLVFLCVSMCWGALLRKQADPGLRLPSSRRLAPWPAARHGVARRGYGGGRGSAHARIACSGDK